MTSTHLFCKCCALCIDFNNGNIEQILCNKCISFHCKQCFIELKTDLESDTHLCKKCYKGPQHFTFFDWEIAEYEEEREYERDLILNRQRYQLRNQESSSEEEGAWWKKPSSI